MAKPPPMSPDVRDSLRGYLTTSIKTFLVELGKRYFPDPATAESRQVLLEANAEALHELTKNEPHGPAILQTFAAELQDKERK